MSDLTPSRYAALAVVLIGFAALGLQLRVSLTTFDGDLGAALWRLAGFFTVLTNLLVTLGFAAVALGWRVSGRFVAGMVLWIGLVGVVYHLLLARLWSPQGLAWWADQGLHSVVPLAVAAWWLAFCPPWRAGLGAVLGWMLWPLAYVVYAVLRGALTGFWPYPFLDPGLHGAAGVLVNVAGLTLGFALAGAAVAAVDRWRFHTLA